VQLCKIHESDWRMLLILTESKSIDQSYSQILHSGTAIFSAERSQCKACIRLEIGIEIGLNFD